MNKTPPCHNCICVAICRHKTYRDLYMNCQLLKDHITWNLREGPDKPFLFGLLHDILKPTLWNITSSGNVETNQGYIMRETDYGY